MIGRYLEIVVQIAQAQRIAIELVKTLKNQFNCLIARNRAIASNSIGPTPVAHPWTQGYTGYVAKYHLLTTSLQNYVDRCPLTAIYETDREERSTDYLYMAIFFLIEVQSIHNDKGT